MDSDISEKPQYSEFRVIAMVDGEQEDEQDVWQQVFTFSRRAIQPLDYFVHQGTITALDAMGNQFGIELPPSYRKGGSVRVICDGREAPVGPRIPKPRKAKP